MSLYRIEWEDTLIITKESFIEAENEDDARSKFYDSDLNEARVLNEDYVDDAFYIVDVTKVK